MSQINALLGIFTPLFDARGLSVAAGKIEITGVDFAAAPIASEKLIIQSLAQRRGDPTEIAYLTNPEPVPDGYRFNIECVSNQGAATVVGRPPQVQPPASLLLSRDRHILAASLWADRPRISTIRAEWRCLAWTAGLQRRATETREGHSLFTFWLLEAVRPTL